VGEFVVTNSIGLTVDEVLTTTRNVRKRLDFNKPVPRHLLEECLDLALQAPNGSNNQNWEWVLVDDTSVIQEIADINYRAYEDFHKIVARFPKVLDDRNIGRNERMGQISESVYYLIENMSKVPVVVLPLLAAKVGANPNTFYQASNWGSILQAAWSFMLACRSRGLGSAWTTLHLWREEEMADLLGFSNDRYTQVGLFPVAYTKGTDFRAAQRRPAAEVMHWNRF
jgi:nitroreductase